MAAVLAAANLMHIPTVFHWVAQARVAPGINPSKNSGTSSTHAVSNRVEEKGKQS